MASEKMSTQEILSHFALFTTPETYGDGHINDTYFVKPTCSRYILQKVNNHVFPHPEEVMSNIEKVTAHLRKKIIEEGGDPHRGTLTLIPALDGKSYYKTPDGEYYRVSEFIEGTHTDSVVEKPEHFYNAAKAFGHFQRLLADFPAEELYEVIPLFHDTRNRFDNLQKAIAEDKMNRVKDVAAEIAFVNERKNEVGIIVDALADGSLPLRVTHNDTKYNNIMLDDITGEAVCIIDLDTVMPGSLLYDYGDSLRFGTNPVAEDEVNLDLVYCDMTLFKAFTRGFIEATGDALTENERKLMPLSAQLITLECGMRFLTDYLDGDHYFRIHRPNQNLDRTRTQFKLVADMEKKEAEMKAYIASL